MQTKSLDMHIRWKEIGAVFAVEKPGHLDGKKCRHDKVANDSDHKIGRKVVCALRRVILAANLAAVDHLQKAAEQMALTAVRALHREPAP